MSWISSFLASKLLLHFYLFIYHMGSQHFSCGMPEILHSLHASSYLKVLRIHFHCLSISEGEGLLLQLLNIDT